MRLSRLIAVALAAFAASGPGARADLAEQLVAPDLCPKAEILCLQRLGYNWQKCGTLSGAGGAAEQVPLCPAADGYACVPCAFGSVAETRARCQASFGPDCSHFTEHNAYWQGEWGRFPWPTNATLYRLLGGGPH